MRNQSWNTRKEIFLQYEPNPFGGRLAYFGHAANPAFWDDRWDKLESEKLYDRARQGVLQYYLRDTFLRWVKPDSKVLEAGCGLGAFTVATFNKGYRSEGVDFAPNVIQQLNKRFPHIKFFQGDVRDLKSIPNGHYDAVYSPGVCEHFREGPDAVLTEAHRILRKEGIFILTAPLFNPLRRLLSLLGCFGSKESREIDFYQYAFTERELSLRLRKVAFTVVQTRPYGAWQTCKEHFWPLSKINRKSIERYIGFFLNHVPAIRWIGHMCVWVGKKN